MNRHVVGWSRDLCLVFCVAGLLVGGTPLRIMQAEPLPPHTLMLTVGQTQVLQSLRRANIIYLGETHNQLADHQAQRTIIEALHRSNPKLTLAMEMFQRPYQAILDDYLAGKLDEATLLTQTEYRQRWGFDWSLYAPIVRFAKAKNLPILALNTPTEVTRKVARQGLAGLSLEERQWVPPFSEIDVSHEAYRQRLLSLYTSFHQTKGNSDGFERFLQAQALWDETMAEVIAQYWLKHPDRQLIVLAGQGHILYRDGIPNRVDRRLQASGRNWQQVSIILNPSPKVQAEGSQAADFFWSVSSQP